MAAGQGQYLVTWQEPSTVPGYELFAQRYRPDGTRVGPVITLSAAPASVYCPVAAWNGSRWLVVWTDGRSGSQDVYGTMVSVDGSVDPAGGSVISAEAGAQRRPAVAGTGSGWVVAWGDFRNGNEDIYAARIAANGTVRDPDGLPVTTAPGWQQAPAVASMGGATLVAWTGPAVERRLLRADGSFAGGPVSAGDRRRTRSQVAAAASEDAIRSAVRRRSGRSGQAGSRGTRRHLSGERGRWWTTPMADGRSADGSHLRWLPLRLHGQLVVLRLPERARRVDRDRGGRTGPPRPVRRRASTRPGSRPSRTDGRSWSVTGVLEPHGGGRSGGRRSVAWRACAATSRPFEACSPRRPPRRSTPPRSSTSAR